MTNDNYLEMSDEAEQDLWQLVDFQLEFAKDQLQKNGEFFPYGAAIYSRDGELVAMAAELGDDRPLSQDVLDALLDGVRAQRADLRAVAITADVTLAGGIDAVRIEFEHISGVAATVLVAYKLRRLRKPPNFLEMTTVPSKPRIWLG